MTSVATLVMERIIDVSKTSNVWTDNVNMTLSAILSVRKQVKIVFILVCI